MAKEVADFPDLGFDLLDQSSLGSLVSGGDSTRSQDLDEMGNSAPRVFAVAERTVILSFDVKGVEVVFQRLAPDFVSPLEVFLLERVLKRVFPPAPDTFPQVVSLGGGPFVRFAFMFW